MKKPVFLIFFMATIALTAELYPTVNGFAQDVQSDTSPKTKVIILGVKHSPQLISKTYQPAVFRAFIDRIKPDAICIERSPQEFARNDFYEFTYEQQYLVVPYARERDIPICAVDWLPDAEDTLLAYGIADLEEPPFVRRDSGFQGFMSFSNKENLNLNLFYAESEDEKQKQEKFANTLPKQTAFDYPRRLYLYRTFMQAKRIAQAARAFRGKTVLVVIGSLHKNDIEQILENDSVIEIVQASVFGQPDAESIKKAVKREDLFAVASFNLLGVQSKTGNIDWDWMKQIIKHLEEEKPTAETLLLKTRLQVLQKQIAPREAMATYQKVYDLAKPDEQFTWDGVKNEGRVDSYFDPFGNLSIKQRAMLELARENAKAGNSGKVEELKNQLRQELSTLKTQQLTAYWDEYVIKMF